MGGRPTRHPLQADDVWRQVPPLRGCCRSPFSNTLSSTDFTRRRRPTVAIPTRYVHARQAGCMAKTEKRQKSPRLPQQIDRALRAAEDKKAEDMVVLDLRKAAGFTDFFVICSGSNPRQIPAIADGVMEALAAAGTKP